MSVSARGLHYCYIFIHRNSSFEFNDNLVITLTQF